MSEPDVDLHDDPLPALDTAPEFWVEEHPEPTADEIQLGNQLGASIDVNDDDDVSGDVAPELVQATG